MLYSAFLINITVAWKKLVRDKHVSLFQPAVSAEEKKFYNIDPWLGRSVGGTQVRAQSYKYFFAII